MPAVDEKFCDERHKQLETHEGRIAAVETAVVLLTEMVNGRIKKDFFDKAVILITVLLCIIIGGIVVGPEVIKKFIGP